MRLAVCIPIYNKDVAKLVADLASQVGSAHDPVEIVLIDDGSEERYRDINQKHGESCKYIELPQNVGRARVRNLFPEYTQAEYLLFIDCDSGIIKDDFIATYLKQLKSGLDVICGASIYQENDPGPEQRLRWVYGREAESLSVEERKASPNKAFKTNNFLIRRELFVEVKFDERITEYGHEDTLFGYALMKKGVAVHHINNPVLNPDLETNQEFLDKTTESVRSLVKIVDFMNASPDFMEFVELLNFYRKTRGWRWLIRACFYLSKPIIEKRLSRGKVNLKLFSFYKLGVLLRIQNKNL